MMDTDDIEEPAPGNIITPSDAETAYMEERAGIDKLTGESKGKIKSKELGEDKSRKGEPYRLKIEPPGPWGEAKVLYAVAHVVREGIGYRAGGYDPKSSIEALRVILANRLDKLMISSGVGDDDGVLPTRDENDRRSARSHYPSAIKIPMNWYGYVTSPQGRGKARSMRSNMSALTLLAYIVHAYRKPGRFDGELLWLNHAIARDRFQMSRTDYDNAVEYLGTGGFISRVVISGYVPWDSRVGGTYRFAVPRLAKLTHMTRYRKKGLKAP